MNANIKKPNDLVIENARILYRNFKGEESAYNRKGDRNFCVIIDNPEFADELINDGWNVKYTNPKEDSDYDPVPYLPVRVNFDVMPPNVFAVTRKKKTRLTANTVESLDYAEIKSVDLTIRPRIWEIGGKSGIKAYLKTMYAVVEEDEFADKYDDRYTEED